MSVTLVREEELRLLEDVLGPLPSDTSGCTFDFDEHLNQVIRALL
nr:hypothetical protein [Corallococcus coralloides]